MAMQTTSDNTAGEPMMEINTTPLIDVMLVMIIMLIITIPPQTHAVKLDLPQNTPNNEPPPVDPIKNKVVITTDGGVLWNGAQVNLDQLKVYLEASQQMNPVPELHLQMIRRPPAAGAGRPLRGGRRGSRGHKARQGDQDGLRRQRRLHEVVGASLGE